MVFKYSNNQKRVLFLLNWPLSIEKAVVTYPLYSLFSILSRPVHWVPFKSHDVLVPRTLTGYQTDMTPALVESVLQCR